MLHAILRRRIRSLQLSLVLLGTLACAGSDLCVAWQGGTFRWRSTSILSSAFGRHVRNYPSAKTRAAFGTVEPSKLTSFCLHMTPTAGSRLESIGGHIQRVDDEDSAAALIDKHDNFIFDCDGVLWAGSHALEGSMDTVKALRRAGKRTFFVTNNSSKSRRQYCGKLEGFGVLGVRREDIITSGSAIAEYIKRTHPDVRAVYMVGDVGLEEELQMVGLRIVKERMRPAPQMTEEDFMANILDPEVGAVVVGYDTCFGFRQICVASSYIQKGAHFLGTNPDRADRVGSLLMPGTGPLLAGIEVACGVVPTVVGKPNPILIRQLMDVNKLDASKTLMVGDRVDTDIMFGNAGGTSTALVLSGVSKMADVVDLPQGGASTPTYLMGKLGDLFSAALGAADSAEGSAKGVSSRT